MYLNVFQRYMKELIDEYGPLLKRQLLIMVNFHIGSRLKNIDGYAFQMCQFGNFQTGRLGGDEYIGYKGETPNIDMIRSVDVMLAFLPNVRQHRKSSGLVSIKFLAGTDKHEKEISIIPVKYGMEKTVSEFANDKIVNEKCELVVFLQEDKNQIPQICTECHCKYALLGAGGVEFYTPK